MAVGAFFVFLWANPPGSVGGHLESTGRWIELDPVSGAFASAYERQEVARKAVRRNEAYDRTAGVDADAELR